jgi:hypothetical protein
LSIPNSSTAVVGTEAQVIGKGMIKNESTDSVFLTWKRTIIEITDGWETAVCDKNLCYIPTIEEMELALAGGEESIFNIYIYPNGISGGAAIVELTATDRDNPNNTVTGRYGFNQSMLKVTVPATSLEVLGDETQVIAEGTIKNESTDSVTVRWKRNVIKLTDGWETAVCDKNLCYIPTVEEMELELAGGEESTFNIYVYPNGISGGEAIIELTATDINNPNNSITGRYEFNQNTTSTFAVKKTDIKIFPNPTTNYISLTEADEVDHIVIYNIVGRPVKMFDVNYGNRYNVIDLPTGMYLVRLMGRNDKTIKTVRLSKKSGA